MRKCPKCNKTFEDDVLSCPDCGKATRPVKEKKKKNVRFRDFFSHIFKKHTKEEKAELFICGTEKTTPKLTDIDASSVHPWIYSRIFGMLFITMTLLAVCVFAFRNANTLPGFIAISSFLVPITCVFFFFEINITRNISFAKIIKYLLVGGCSSLLLTIVIYQFAPSAKDISYGMACLISVIEEFGKAFIVCFIIFKLKAKYRLNGLLIGSIIGAGFAAFESAGYAFNAYVNNALVNGTSEALTSMITTTLARGLLAPGGHVVWAAFCGYGLEVGIEKRGFSPLAFLSPSFWLCFLLSFALHAIWDMPFDFLFIKEIVLLVVSWIFILIFIRKGLKQVAQMAEKEKAMLLEPTTPAEAEVVSSEK